ncbi:transposase [Escherichia coli]|uniref:transposase n=1 Tax=Escherichia coli TaxID=562 RepID=UPI003C78C267
MQKNVTPGRRKGCPNYPPEFKQLLVAASCEPGISISKLALENGINANLLFKWRQQWREGKAAITFFREPPATSCDSRCSCRTARIARRGPGNPQYQL